MARTTKNANKNVNKNADEVKNENINNVNLNDFDIITETNIVQDKPKKTFNIKLSPYLKQFISCDGGSIKITNEGFGDVLELNSNEILYTGDTKVFKNDIIIESASFPKVKVEIF